MDHRNELGRQGENIAAAFLQKKGYDVAEQNWRCYYGEIDLIVTRGEEIRFIEVKMRESLASGYPEESVTDSKLNRLEGLAHVYLDKHDISDSDFHIDVIAIGPDEQGKMELRYLMDVG
ncbi:MAG: YraN family protein [Patescibacteria group bacterium]